MSNKTLITVSTELAPTTILDGIEKTMSKAHMVQTIETRDQYAEAGELVKALNGFIKTVSDQRKELTAPLDAAKKSLTSQEKAITSPIMEEMARIKDTMAQYKEEEERRIFAEETARREAEADAAMSAIIGIHGGSLTAQPILPTVELAAKSDGATSVKTWDFEITEPEQVPRQFCTPDPKKIRAWMEYFKKIGTPIENVVMPGIKVFSKTTIRVK